MKSFDKSKLKKQLVSGGIYIALAAAVVTVTLNGVNNIIGGSSDYDMSEEKLEIPEADINLFDDGSVLDKDGDSLLAAPDDMDVQREPVLFDSTDVSGNEIGVTSEIASPEADIETTENTVPGITSDHYEDNAQSSTTEENSVTASGEPDDIEYPTEPEPDSYGFYAKPADGYIDKEFSDDDLIYSTTMGDYRTHNGVDITGDLSSPVKAINAGTVVDIYFDDFYGNTIKIDHGNGLVAYYMNLSEALPAGIEVGVKVKNGQTIGGIGNSAAIESAEVSHLHLSVTKDGKYIDPRELLRNNY